MAPPSVNKLPSLMTRNTLSTTTLCRPLFQGTEHRGQSGQIIKYLPIGSDALPIPATDGAVMEDPPTSTDLTIPSSSSEVIDKLEIASGKVMDLPADKTAMEAPPAPKDLLEVLLSPTATNTLAATLRTEPATDKRRRSQTAKGATNSMAKKNKN